MGGRRIVLDSDDDDTVDFSSESTKAGKAAPTKSTATAKEVAAAAAPKSATVRRRKLGAVQDDRTLLYAWKVDQDDGKARRPRLRARAAKANKQPKQHVELRTRRTRRISELPADDAGEISTEEATMLEDVTLNEGDKEEEEEEEGKEGKEQEEEDEEEEGEDEDNDNEDDDDDTDGTDTDFHETSDDSSDDSLGDFFPSPPHRKHLPAPTSKPQTAAKKSQRIASPPQMDDTGDQSTLFFSAEESLPVEPVKSTRRPEKAGRKAKEAGRPSTPPPPSSPPSTPPRGLVSPSKKLPRIPMTPHQPSTDAFWDQGLVDSWNTEHSPRKLLFDPGPALPKKKAAGGAAPTAAAREREAKRTFQKSKHETAEQFLAELDTTITKGELGRLAATTGGVRIVWTNKLNTTAGRANWRRETLRPKGATSTDPESVVRVLHHASIELAEKVIDDENRLLNVLAHEFCHLANFMVSGITSNPHGREFKAWASQCSRHFSARGIEVTTRHTYEIDFRYVWTCVACATQYKRHSKSIDPTRHRCGSCRGQLQQTKPVPCRGKAKAEAGAGAGSVLGNAPKLPPAPTAYQKFMKENMALLRRENPGSPQKLIMKMVAERWTQAKKEKAAESGEAGKKETAGTTGVVHLNKAFVDLKLN